MEHIHTPYVLVLLEDYYLTDFNEERFYTFFNYMKQAKSAYMQIWGDYKGPKDREGGEVFPGVAVKNKNEEWRTSLQACIWRVEDLRHLLKKGENPWEFERAGSIRSEGSKEKFLIVYKESPVNYLNMTQLGYVNGDNLRALQTMGIEFKPQTLKIDDDHKLKLWFKRQFIHDVYWNVVEPVIRGVTGFLKGL